MGVAHAALCDGDDLSHTQNMALDARKSGKNRFCAQFFRLRRHLRRAVRGCARQKAEITLRAALLRGSSYLEKKGEEIVKVRYRSKSIPKLDCNIGSSTNWIARAHLALCIWWSEGDTEDAPENRPRRPDTHPAIQLYFPTPGRPYLACLTRCERFVGAATSCEAILPAVLPAIASPAVLLCPLACTPAVSLSCARAAAHCLRRPGGAHSSHASRRSQSA